jgi:hypothetical protein
MSGASQHQRTEQPYRSPADNRDIGRVNPPPPAHPRHAPEGRSWTLTRSSSRDYI